MSPLNSDFQNFLSNIPSWWNETFKLCRLKPEGTHIGSDQTGATGTEEKLCDVPWESRTSVLSRLAAWCWMVSRGSTFPFSTTKEGGHVLYSPQGIMFSKLWSGECRTSSVSALLLVPHSTLNLPRCAIPLGGAIFATCDIPLHYLSNGTSSAKKVASGLCKDSIWYSPCHIWQKGTHSSLHKSGKVTEQLGLLAFVRQILLLICLKTTQFILFMMLFIYRYIHVQQKIFSPWFQNFLNEMYFFSAERSELHRSNFQTEDRVVTLCCFCAWVFELLSILSSGTQHFGPHRNLLRSWNIEISSLRNVGPVEM